VNLISALNTSNIVQVANFTCKQMVQGVFFHF